MRLVDSRQKKFREKNVTLKLTFASFRLFIVVLERGGSLLLTRERGRGRRRLRVYVVLEHLRLPRDDHGDGLDRVPGGVELVQPEHLAPLGLAAALREDAEATLRGARDELENSKVSVNYTWTHISF